MRRLPPLRAVCRLMSAALLAQACSHDIESPAVSSQAVSPDVVCAEQLKTPVKLTGDGFTPMPAKTLEPSNQLLLPQVQLNLTKELTGASASQSVAVPDDPANAAASQLQWTSEQQMTFIVTPGLLVPGVYDVVVTNPDGKHAATFSGDFVAVPRPTLTRTAPDIFCDQEADQTVTLTGTTLLEVNAARPTVHVAPASGGAGMDFPVMTVDGCTAVPGMHTETALQSCTGATFVIPKGTFMPGAYNVTLTNPSPAGCTSTDPLSVTVVPAPAVASIAADLTCDAQSAQMFTVTGAGFLQLGTQLPVVTVGTQMFMPAAISGCTGIAGAFAEGAAQSCTTLSFMVPSGTFAVTMPTAFPVVVTNPPPADCKSLETVNLEVVPPPAVTSAMPLAICDAQGAQVLTLTGTSFLEVGTTLPAIQIGMQMFMPTMATGCSAVPGTFAEGVVQMCTGLTLSVPQGTFAPGMYAVTVTNPAPGGCASTQLVSLDVVPPPTVTGTTPATLCQGGGNLTVNGSGFASTATVSLQSSGQPTVKSASSIVDMSGMTLSATFGGPLNPGNVYDVVVDDADGCSDSAPHKQVTVVTGPVAFFADPNPVYNGINTSVTIYLTTLQCAASGPCATVTMTPAGMLAPVTNLTVTGTVPGHPNRLQAIIPQGTAAGTYDLHIVDATTCGTTLPDAIDVTSTLTLALKSVIPPFGWTQRETAVTVLRDTTNAGMTAPFVPTPRVFLNPSPTQPAGNGCPALSTAIALQSVSFVDQDTLTAVVPKNQPTCLYDLIVVNPDKTTGTLPGAFTVQSAQPPVINTVTPSSIVAATGQQVVVAGQSFNASTLTVRCVDAMGNPVAAPAVVSGMPACAAGNCTQNATLNASTLAVGDVCVLRVTNADGAYFDYSAIGVTTPSLNLSATHQGTALNVGRRALATASGNATAAARFVYAIGGDPGAAMAGAPFSSTEVASVDLFGKMGNWSLQPSSTLATARSFPAYATSGRYIYVAGGFDGTSALKSAERALILSPDEAPALDIDDLVPNANGLDPGVWIYRVSASFSASDPDNPSGESLPSDEIIVRVPTFSGKKIQVVLTWSSPADVLGVPLPNVSGFNVYRTPVVNGASGGEVLLATVNGATLKFTDDGSATPGTLRPLPLGSTGQWAQLPALATARKGAAGAIAPDPSDPGKLYFYAALGADTAGTGLTSYEYLPITVQPNGHQTAAAWTTGAHAAAAGRWQLGAFVADRTVSTNVPAGSTFVYLGGGVGSTSVEAGLVSAGGDLGVLAAEKSFGVTQAGYGVCAANGQLFAFGGANAAPSGGAKSATVASPAPALAAGAWNDEGIALKSSRYLMGSAVQSAFIFLIAGDTGGGVGSTTTETVIW
jgi:hypothetical protein